MIMGKCLLIDEDVKNNMTKFYWKRIVHWSKIQGRLNRDLYEVNYPNGPTVICSVEKDQKANEVLRDWLDEKGLELTWKIKLRKM